MPLKVWPLSFGLIYGWRDPNTIRLDPMTQEQGDKIISLLENILAKLQTSDRTLDDEQEIERQVAKITKRTEGT